MRWLNYNGLNARGFFNLFAKPKSLSLFFDIVAGQGGFLAAGMSLITGETKTETRFSTSFSALAQNTPDTLVGPPFNRFGVQSSYHVPGRFIIADNGGHVADSTDGVSWHTGALNGPAGVPLVGGYGTVFDDVNNVIVGAPDFSAPTPFIFRGPNTRPLNFSTVALPAGAANTISIAYKGAGTGVCLCNGSGNLVNRNNIYKSLDGGATWTLVGHTAFAGAQILIRGQTHWLAIGNNGLSLSYSLSTDDGATWTAQTLFPGANNTSATGSVATDGLGNFVVIGAAPNPDNYWVSSNDGVTFTSPNLFHGNGGVQGPGNLIFSGGNWLAAFVDPTFSWNFLATSVDGSNWVKGLNVIDSP